MQGTHHMAQAERMCLTATARELHAVTAMTEAGIDISAEFPKPWVGRPSH
jgi:hypothetical protein